MSTECVWTIPLTNKKRIDNGEVGIYFQLKRMTQTNRHTLRELSAWNSKKEEQILQMDKEESD